MFSGAVQIKYKVHKSIKGYISANVKQYRIMIYSEELQYICNILESSRNISETSPRLDTNRGEENNRLDCSLEEVDK